MKFLVTGATGFIGQRVVCQLLKKNIPVVATDIILSDEFIKYYLLMHFALSLVKFDIKFINI